MKIYNCLFAVISIITFTACGGGNNAQEENTNTTAVEPGPLTKDSTGQELEVFGSARIKVPLEFTQLTDEEKAAKYPGPNAPETVFANEDGTVSIAFTFAGQPLSEKELPDYLRTTQEAIQQALPDAVWEGTEVKKINGNPVGMMKFESPAADGRIYNIMCFAVVDSKLAMYSFNCMTHQKAEWEAKGNAIVNSFKIYGK